MRHACCSARDDAQLEVLLKREPLLGRIQLLRDCFWTGTKPHSNDCISDILSLVSGLHTFDLVFSPDILGHFYEFAVYMDFISF